MTARLELAEHLIRVKAHVTALVAYKRRALHACSGRNLPVKVNRLNMDAALGTLGADPAPNVALTYRAVRVDANPVESGENVCLSHRNLRNREARG